MYTEQGTRTIGTDTGAHKTETGNLMVARMMVVMLTRIMTLKLARACNDDDNDTYDNIDNDYGTDTDSQRECRIPRGTIW